MNISAINKIIEKENKEWPLELKIVPKEKWPTVPQVRLFKVWRSRGFIVQEYQEDKAIRLTVNRTVIDDKGDYVGGNTWEELQSLKHQCGYSDRCGVEIYPPDKDVMNVANMRHLWIPDDDPEYRWNKK